MVQIHMPAGSTRMKLVSTNQSKGMHIYQNPIDKEEYEMPIQWIDVNSPVFIDKDENIWHKGEILGGDSEENSRMSHQNDNIVINSQYLPNINKTQTVAINNNNNNNKIASYQQLQSNTSLSFTDTISPNQFYNIKFLSPNYVYTGTNLPSDKDIQEVRENVQGKNVQGVI